MKPTHVALIATGLATLGLILFLNSRGGPDSQDLDRDSASRIEGGGSAGDEDLAAIPGNDSDLRERAAVSRTANGTAAGDAVEVARTLTVQIQWPSGAVPSNELKVYAFDYPIAGGAMARALTSDATAIAIHEAKSTIFDDLDDPTDDASYVLAHVEATASVEEVGDRWSAQVGLPQSDRRVWLHALGGGFHSSRGLEVRPDESVVELSVDAGARLSIVVTSKSESAELQGTQVRLETAQSGAAMMAMGSQSSTRFRSDVTLDAAGRAEIATVPADTAFGLRIRGDGVTPYVMQVPPLTAGEQRTIEVELNAGAAIHGQVVDSTGRAVAAEKVTAAIPGKAFGFDDEVVRTVSADSEGKFTIPNLGEGIYVVRADTTGLLESPREKVEIIGDVDVSGLKFVLEEGKTISGTVELFTGERLAGVEVHARFDPSHMAGMSGMSAGRGAKGTTRSLEDGTFRITGLGSGPFVLSAEVPAPEAARGQGTWRVRMDGVRHSAEGVLLIIRPLRTLSGTVVNDQGVPIAGETVTCARVVSGSLGDVHLDQHEARSDDEGAFTLSGLESGSWSLSVTSERHITIDDVAVELDRSTEGITVVAQRTVTVRGRVLDPSGIGHAGARVGEVPSEPAWQASLSRKPTSMTTRTRDDGSFELTGMPPGRLQLRATAERFGPTVGDPIPASAGELVENVTLQLSQGGTIEGIVFDDEGRAAAGRIVVVQEMNMSMMRTVPTGADGTFRALGLTPGKYQVIAMNPEMEMDSVEDGSGMAAMFESMNMATATVQDGETTLVILGAPPAHPVEVSGQVTMTGEPYVDVLVSWMPMSGGMYEKMKVTSTDEEGRYSLTLDDSGDYLVNVTKMAGNAGQQMTVEFNASVPQGSDDFEKDIAVPGGTIAGRVVNSDGDPIAGARVTVMGTGPVRTDRIFGGSYSEIVTEADGSFEATGLRAGEYQVAGGGAAPMGESSSARARVVLDGISLADDQRVDGVEIELPEPGQVEVTVRDGAGTAVGGATIFVRDEKGRHTEILSMVTTGPDGTVVVRGLAPGIYTLAARTEQLASDESAPVRVTAGEEARVAVVLESGTRIVAEVKARRDEVLVAADVLVLDAEGRDVSRRIGIIDIQSTYAQSDFSLYNRRIGPLPPGRYTVSATTADGRKARRRVVLAGEPEKKVSLVLR